MSNDQFQTIQTPLESFIHDYVSIAGGAWDEVERQVVDVMLPPDMASEMLGKPNRDMIRLAFDPEAVSEHPGSQLASHGTPLVDRLLASAAQRGRFARAFLNGLDLTPHKFTSRISESISLAEPLTLEIDSIRPHDFPQAVFCFLATFSSDHQEHQIIRQGIDLHLARHVRHLDRVVDQAHLSEEPALLLPEAPSICLAQAYPLVRERALRTVAPLAGSRQRELNQRAEQQLERITGYYESMRAEINGKKGIDNQQDERANLQARIEIVDREQRVRIADIRRKSVLQVQLRLLNLLVVYQPKLLASGTLRGPESTENYLELVWDSLTNSLEAVSCPTCGSPTFEIGCDSEFSPLCPGCPPATENMAVELDVPPSTKIAA